MRTVAALLALALAAGGTAAGAGAAPAHTSKGKHAKKAKKHCKRRHHHCAKKHAAHPAGGGSHTPPPVVDPPKPPTKPAGPGTPTPPPTIGHLQVIAREFSLTPSRQTLASGTVAVELDNLGQDPHDLRVERTDDPAGAFQFPTAKASTVTSRKLTLGPGTWKLYCSLPEHDGLGMHAFVTVTQ